MNEDDEDESGLLRRTPGTCRPVGVRLGGGGKGRGGRGCRRRRRRHRRQGDCSAGIRRSRTTAPVDVEGTIRFADLPTRLRLGELTVQRCLYPRPLPC